MVVALIILAEIASVVGTFVITFNTLIDSILEIPKNGYKIDKKVIDKYSEKHSMEKYKDSRIKKIINTICLFIPGVNLIRAGIGYHKAKKIIMNDPNIVSATVRMTEEEVQQFESLKGKIEKMGFVAAMSVNDEKPKIFGFSNNLPVVLKDGLIRIHKDEVMPLDLTYDEVLELSSAAGGYCKTGLLDNSIPVAFIAVPSIDCNFDKVQFSFEDYKNTHNFMESDDFIDPTFRVYQVIDNLKISSSIGSAISNIQRRRNSQDMNNDMDDKVNELLLFEQKDDNEKGVVLQKSLFPKGDN